MDSKARRRSAWPDLRGRLTPASGIGGVAVLLALVVLVAAIIVGEVPELFGDARHWVEYWLGGQRHLLAFGLLYVEESGIPLPAPGDVFVMYVGAQLPHTAAVLLAAWLGLILAVVLGASNLYLLSRKVGGGIAETRIGRFAHLTPERPATAERRFARYGVLAIIFGRHIPGLRVPITVAAGVFRVPYRTFAISVGISAAIWAGVFLAIGVVYGPGFERLLRLHRGTYWLLAAGVVLVVAAFVFSHLRAARKG